MNRSDNFGRSTVDGPATEKKASRFNFERAERVLESLIQGHDPITGDELPPDTVVNQIEVNRALVAAVAAIRQAAARAARRALLPNSVGKSWSAEEEETMAAAYRRGDSIPEIANRHSRTNRAIEVRLELMGLLKPEQRTPHGAFNSTLAPKKTNRRKRTASPP